jgi:hypothetical protein
MFTQLPTPPIIILIKEVINAARDIIEDYNNRTNGAEVIIDAERYNRLAIAVGKIEDFMADR